MIFIFIKNKCSASSYDIDLPQDYRIVLPLKTILKSIDLIFRKSHKLNWLQPTMQLGRMHIVETGNEFRLEK